MTATGLVVLVAAGSLAACVARPSPSPSAQGLKILSGEIRSVRDFESAVEHNMQKAGVTGLSVAIINDGRVTHVRGFGWKDKDAGTRMDGQTVLDAASLSKTVFAYLVVVLAEEGLLDLDAPLQRYLEKPLPEYPSYADLASDPRYRALTARMALSHTTGFPNWRPSTATGRLRIRFEPGSRFSYSGEGIQLLQMVVESVTGKDLETLAREKVFIPFKMSHTSYVWRESLAPYLAAPHNEFEWARDPDRPTVAMAAGSMVTTAGDYAQFLVGLLAAEGKRAESVRRMLTPVIPITSQRMFGPRADSMQAPTEGRQLAWGLGWGLFDTPYGQAFFHTGHKGGTQNYAVVYPDRRIGIVLLSNSDNFESVALAIVAAGIGEEYSPFDWLGYEPYDPARRKPAPPRLIAIAVSPQILAPYAGEYRLGQTIIHVKVDAGRLYLSDDGMSWDELLAKSETVFFFKGRTVTVTFVSDAEGRLERLDLDGVAAATLSAPRIR